MSDDITDAEAGRLVRNLRQAHQKQEKAMQAWESGARGAEQSWRDANHEKAAALRAVLGDAT